MEQQFDHIEMDHRYLSSISVTAGIHFDDLNQAAFDELAEKLNAWLASEPELGDEDRTNVAAFRRWHLLRTWTTAQETLPDWWFYTLRNDQAKVITILSRNGEDLEFPTRVFRELITTRDMAGPFFSKVIYGLDRHVKEARAGVEMDWHYFLRDMANHLAVFSNLDPKQVLEVVKRLFKDYINKAL